MTGQSDIDFWEVKIADFCQVYDKCFDNFALGRSIDNYSQLQSDAITVYHWKMLDNLEDFWIWALLKILQVLVLNEWMYGH